MEGLSDQLQTAAGIKGIDGYLAAFPNALRGLEGRRLRNVVEAVHSGVLEGWRPTEENVAAIAQSRERGPMTPSVPRRSATGYVHDATTRNAIETTPPPHKEQQ